MSEPSDRQPSLPWISSAAASPAKMSQPPDAGAGLDGARSGLWREFRRVVSEIRPTWIVVENVASGSRRWLPPVRRDLHMLGYGSLAVALSAFDVGAPQQRANLRGCFPTPTATPCGTRNNGS
jgi:site-specific DNA-cytosine methylase